MKKMLHLPSRSSQPLGGRGMTQMTKYKTVLSARECELGTGESQDSSWRFRDCLWEGWHLNQALRQVCP